MRTRHPEADIDRETFFEPVFTGWVASVPVMYNDWRSGTGNATQIPSASIMRLGIPGHLPGLVPKPFPIRRKSWGAIPETWSQAPDPRPGRSRSEQHALCLVLTDMTSRDTAPPLERDPRVTVPRTKDLTTNDHHYP